VQAYATILSAVTVFGMSNTTNTVTPSTWMSFKDVLAEIAISRSTINKWRSEGRGPSFIRLPNGELRIRRSEFEAWLIELPKVA
jgi:predicted DNA-binding transcriptional regulator AlpA